MSSKGVETGVKILKGVLTVGGLLGTVFLTKKAKTPKKKYKKK